MLEHYTLDICGICMFPHYILTFSFQLLFSIYVDFNFIGMEDSAVSDPDNITVHIRQVDCFY